jgi:GcrA cell cycle regulator
MDWNEERIEALARLWREGHSASQVARQLGGVSRSAVIGKVHRLGIAGREAPSRPLATVSRPAPRQRASSGGVRNPNGTRAPRRVPPPAARFVVFEATATATIHTLTPRGCRWPIGEPEEASFGFCGRLCDTQGSYCAGHAPMAVRRRDTPMKTKEIERIAVRFAESGSAVRSDFSIREIA